ncbi:MAG: integrase core domain-containing protein [Hyphomicrobiales bacterium]|nr:integrase core domain-containing protein [Hyphomicrobiales bacterium]
MSAERICREMDRVIEQHGKPKTIRCDNGPEFVGHAFQNRARNRGIRIEYIQSGKPRQNAYVERLNRTVRCELPEMHDFKSIGGMQTKAYGAAMDLQQLSA